MKITEKEKQEVRKNMLTELGVIGEDCCKSFKEAKTCKNPKCKKRLEMFDKIYSAIINVTKRVHKAGYEPIYSRGVTNEKEIKR